MRYPDDIEIGSINTFILMIKGDDNRNKQTGQFPLGMITMIKFLESVYGKVLWKNTIISISNWGYSSFDIADRRDIYQSEALLTHYWNDVLKALENCPAFFKVGTGRQWECSMLAKNVSRFFSII